MVSSYAALQTDITTRCPGLTEPEAIAAAFAALPPATVQGDTTVGQILTFLASNQLLTVFQALAASTANAALQNAAAALLLALSGGTESPFALSSSANQDLIAGFVTAGVLTSAQQSAALALGQSSVPYTQATYGVAALSIDDVLTALRQ